MTDDCQMLDKAGIEFNHKKYNLKLYLKLKNIIFNLESLDSKCIKKYENSFDLHSLQKLDRYFLSSQDINQAFTDFKYLISENFSIEEGDSFADYIISYRNKPIKIHLIELRVNNKNLYDSLSDQMKTIIDNNELILGIDLGTTYSCASVMLDKNYIVIQNSLGLTTIPSFVLFLENNKICVGELAKLQPSYEGNIIYNVKRLMGKNLNDEEVRSIKDNLSFHLNNDNNFDLLKINVKGQYYFPEQISAMILKKIINDSEYYLSKKLEKNIKIENAVITSPAYFNNKQRQAIINAANIIGLKVKRIINEPTAASLAYLYNNLMNIKNKYIIVLDFGGGTFDITFLKLTQSNNSAFCEIICTGGDPNFGGEDFDEILMKKCVESLHLRNLDKKLPHNVRLKRACENAKIKLSSVDKTNIFIEEYLPNYNIEFSITKEQFEEYCSNLFNDFRTIINNFLINNNVDKNMIEEVIPIGGSSLMPKIKEIISEIFNNSKIETNLDPKEVVAIGASIQGGILSKLNNLNNYDLLDITNYSLGVELVGERMSKIIKKYTKIPISLFKNYENAYDYPESLQIRVYEGEDKNIKNNLFLGEFKISNLPRKKKGEIKIIIEFDINENSLLKVTAKEKENKNNEAKKDISLEKTTIIVENPKGLFLMMDRLKAFENSVKYIEDALYKNNIKDLIIVAENTIIELKKDDGNKEAIKENHKLIIEKFGNFIQDKLNVGKKEEYERKLIISYIKYYFKKISNYLEKYKEDIKFIEDIKKEENLGKILKEIQYYNPNLLPEIIEDFSDNKEIFESCIQFLIENLYGKITEKSFRNKKIEKEKEKDKDYYYQLESEVDNALSLFKKFNNKIPSEIKFIEEYLKDLKVKYEAMGFIVTYKRKFFIVKLFYRTKLKDLIARYSNCRDIDINVLKELKDISNKSLDISKEERFLHMFENEKENRNVDMLFLFFVEFPVTEDNHEKYIDEDFKRVMSAWNQERLEKRNEFLNEAIIKYKKSLDSIKVNGDEVSQKVYTKIIELINIILESKGR